MVLFWPCQFIVVMPVDDCTVPFVADGAVVVVFIQWRVNATTAISVIEQENNLPGFVY